MRHGDRRHAVRLGLPGGDAAWVVPPGIRREPGAEREELAGLRQQFAQAKFVRDDARAAELVVESIWGRGRDRIAARCLRHQFPGAGLARIARTRAARDGLIRRAGTETREAGQVRAPLVSAVGANPIAWVIPCHRVLRAGGQTRRISLGNGPQTDDSPLGIKARWGVITF